MTIDYREPEWSYTRTQLHPPWRASLLVGIALRFRLVAPGLGGASALSM
jgi:hypothetical protein